MSKKIRRFKTGATRDTEIGKIDPEGFLSPIVIQAFCDYMNKNRRQKDGTVRPSDNWQLGIPQPAYMKSLWRHMLDLWKFHRGYKGRETIDDALGGVIFNAMGYWKEELEKRK